MTDRILLKVCGHNCKGMAKVLPDKLQYFLIEVDVKAPGNRMLDDQCGRESVSSCVDRLAPCLVPHILKCDQSSSDLGQIERKSVHSVLTLVKGLRPLKALARALDALVNSSSQSTRAQILSPKLWCSSGHVRGDLWELLMFSVLFWPELLARASNILAIGTFDTLNSCLEVWREYHHSRREPRPEYQ